MDKDQIRQALQNRDGERLRRERHLLMTRLKRLMRLRLN